jgi:menaquinone-9 beta-reductase
MITRDLLIIGGGPGGAAAAIRAAEGGAKVTLFEKGPHGRDKVCGDGLTPRAVKALQDLSIDLESAHRIDGLRMIVGKRTREIPWPSGDRFPPMGAVWPRRKLDAFLIDRAIERGVDVRFETEALPFQNVKQVNGVTASGETFTAPLTILAAGAQGAAGKMLGCERDPREPFGLAIRTYAPTPHDTGRFLEASLSLQNQQGVAVPGYGWMFPAGDGTVNIGVGALSTMKGFKKLNLNVMLENYAASVRDRWELGDFQEKPRAWRLPMSSKRRYGRGWLAVGDAAGFVNPMNGEGIDYALESGMIAAEQFLLNPSTAPSVYNRIVGDRFDAFLRTGRRFSYLVSQPVILRPGLRLAIGTQSIASITAQVMGNLVDGQTPGAGGRVMRIADRTLALADPILRRL